MDKILTLIIPTYNMEKYLDKCLTSLVISDSELMKQLEVLVIIDGATDCSSEIAHGYEAKYPDTFRVIDKENGNYGSCINRGLKEATGKYIKVLDADDWFDTAVFEKYLRKLQKLDMDLVLNDANIVDVSGNVTANMAFPCESYKSLNFRDYTKFIERLQMHMVAYKAARLREIGYQQTEGVSYTDQEWITWPLVTVDTFFYISEGLYQYLLGRDGQTMEKSILYNKFGDIATMVLSLGSIWRNYEGEEWKKTMLYKKFSSQVYWKYHEFIKDNLYPEDRFREFDRNLLQLFPEITEVTDVYVDPRLMFEFHLIPLWRKRLLPLYRLFKFISDIKNKRK